MPENVAPASPLRVACVGDADGSAALVRRLRAAGIESVGLRLEDWPGGGESFDALVVSCAAFPSAARLAAFAHAVAAETAVLAVARDAAEEAAVLCAAAAMPPAPRLDACTDGELERLAASRLSLLVARRDVAEERDQLTGLGTRSAMRRHIARVLGAPPAGSAAAVFILDFDYFKRINDTWGHVAGDAVLQRAAALLAESGGPAIGAYRLGGDEFGGVVTGRDRAEVAAILEEARRLAADTPIRVAAAVVRITVSIGFAFLDKGMDVEAAYRQADEAVYSAKSAGRNRVVCRDLFWDAAAESPTQAALAHFENVTRVWTQRMSELITSVGRRAIEESRRSAEHDGLTDVFNRGYFDRRIVREMENARRTATPLSLVMLDVDDFHSVNMRCGYPTGDLALKAVADLARNHSRSTDWVARYGGEEFCVVMPGAQPAEAALAAERFRAALEAATIKGYEQRELRLTASLGVASVGELAPGSVEGAALVQVASDRVIAAKKGGKNRVVAPGTVTSGRPVAGGDGPERLPRHEAHAG